jgi:hypothetical protein
VIAVRNATHTDAPLSSDPAVDAALSLLASRRWTGPDSCPAVEQALASPHSAHVQTAITRHRLKHNPALYIGATVLAASAVAAGVRVVGGPGVLSLAGLAAKPPAKPTQGEPLFAVVTEALPEPQHAVGRTVARNEPPRPATPLAPSATVAPTPLASTAPTTYHLTAKKRPAAERTREQPSKELSEAVFEAVTAIGIPLKLDNLQAVGNVEGGELHIATVVATRLEGAIVEGLTFEVSFQLSPPPCTANCDGSTSNPILNSADFTCFMQRYASGDPAANCDGSTTPPVLNAADFACFLRTFTAGCP